MRAAVLEEAGRPLVIREVELPELGPTDVAVRMVASGVCHSDVSYADGLFGKPIPAILGHEGAGVVTDVGSGVSLVAVGDHVICAWQTACRACAQCLAGQPELCTQPLLGRLPARVLLDGQPVAAMNGLGTFAEAVVLPESCLVRIEDRFSLDVAALVGCAVMTGVGASINTAQVRPGETVAVFGCGGVGLSAIQGARLGGARQIIAVDQHRSKADLGRSNGATDVLVSGEDDVSASIARLTNGVGVDHALDCVGVPATVRAAYLAARPGGSVTVVGIGPLDEPLPLTIGDLLSSKRLKYSRYGGADVQRDFARLLRLNELDRLDLDGLVEKHIALEDVNDALDALRAGSGLRAIIRFDS